MCFTPHSYRAFLPSTFRTIGYTQQDLEWLSAWGAKGSENYVRTGRSNTLQMQTTLAAALRKSNSERDAVGEKDFLRQLRAKLLERGSPTQPPRA